MATIYLKSQGAVRIFMKTSRPIFRPSVSFVHSKVTDSETIDPVDLKHLSSYAKQWWDPNGPLKALNSYNFMRVPYFRDSLVTLTPETPQSTCLRGKKILEVGCGGGVLSEDLAKLGADITGIDPSKELIQAAVEHSAFNTNLTNKPSYVYTTIEEHIKQHSEKYDAVIASEVIEHINTDQREFFIQSCVKALKPGGTIIITTPTRTRMSQLLGVYLVEALNIAPRGSHHYHKFSTQSEVKYWLELNKGRLASIYPEDKITSRWHSLELWSTEHIISRGGWHELNNKQLYFPNCLDSTSKNDCRVNEIRGYAYYFWANEWKWIKWQGLMFAIRAVKLDKTLPKLQYSE